ncbi:hypothetical protein [Plesiomonas shigelloides]|uniref:Uncharacterized protein n=1 Tax=Plesiomonas shigelloides 302-73 TaxID=1315976 RepID=R8AU94_PLESH|nr:hypothetical protein [Plesiomonas shigelloides]EON89902.1 hypothetical protein PLESHI_03049 [Plesiomonas shigelloides 302-73]
MRYIDLDEVEADLPGNRQEQVDAAWVYVNRKMDESEAKVRAEGARNNWSEAEITGKVELARISARKAAISAKNNLWSDLSDLLAEQSSGKCWYCESKELRSDNPIDHFRPKGQVVECSEHPGYWWLAFDWSNYRYSCTYCNSRRVEAESAGGKHDHFPLFTPPDWNKSNTDNNAERPMLLDPTNANDCKLLTFNQNGEACPNESDSSSDNFKRAKISIELYHLNHKNTTRVRKQIHQEIRQLVAATNELLDAGADPRSLAIEANIKNLLRKIRSTCKSTQFNTAARLYLSQFDCHQWVKDILDLR